MTALAWCEGSVSLRMRSDETQRRFFDSVRRGGPRRLRRLPAPADEAAGVSRPATDGPAPGGAVAPRAGRRQSRAAPGTRPGGQAPVRRRGRLARAGFSTSTVFKVLKSWNVDEEAIDGLESIEDDDAPSNDF